MLSLLLWVLFFWLLFAAINGWFAHQKGRSGIAFFLISVVISPMIGLIVVLAIKPSDEVMEQRALLNIEGKTCPFCAEVVRAGAVICEHCGKDITADAPPSIDVT